MKNRLKNMFAFMGGLFVALLILETFLRLYNPLAYAIQNDHFFLKNNYTVQQINPTGIGLDSLVTNKYNSLGFRGEEPPNTTTTRPMIVAVGGSTTACTDIDEGKDWIHQLQKLAKDRAKKDIWVNNGGIVGHSTFGHIQLLRHHLGSLKPDYILFLVGINDIERTDLRKHDIENDPKRYNGWRDWLKKNSRIVLGILFYFNKYKTIVIDVDQERKMVLSPSYSEIDSSKLIASLKRQTPYLLDFEKRLSRMIELSKKLDINPVLITQPLLFGKGIDPYRQIDLEKISCARFDNGLTYWKVLELYNDVTRKIAQKQNITLIDLAQKIPKNSRYFGDAMHFTNAGTQKVAEILWNEWLKVLPHHY